METCGRLPYFLFIMLWSPLVLFSYHFGRHCWVSFTPLVQPDVHCLVYMVNVRLERSFLACRQCHSIFRDFSVNQDVYRSWGVNIQHLIWLFPLSHLKWPNVHPVCLCSILFSTKWISPGDIVGMLLTTQMWMPIEFSYCALGNNIVLLTATVCGLFKQTSEVCTPAFTQK